MIKNILSFLHIFIEKEYWKGFLNEVILDRQGPFRYSEDSNDSGED